MTKSEAHLRLSTGVNLPIIAIDGPSGVGKSTIAWRLSRQLGWNFLDSGAIYRTFALAVSERDELTTRKMLKIAQSLNVEFMPAEDRYRTFWEGRDVTDALREDKISGTASELAQLPEVRATLIPIQQRFAKMPGLVAEGRDMGSVVFPNAVCKIFLNATLDVRTERRCAQLQALGVNGIIGAEVGKNIAKRDTRDESRRIAPLLKTKGALEIESSNLSEEAILLRILSIFENTNEPKKVG